MSGVDGQGRPGDTVGDGHDELRDALVLALDAFRVENHKTDAEIVADIADALLPVVTAFAEQRARERAAEELRAAAWELHVARFNADERPEARWPAGAPRVGPDTFYRGITVAELALRFRGDALAADDRTGQR